MTRKNCATKNACRVASSHPGRVPVVVPGPVLRSLRDIPRYNVRIGEIVGRNDLTTTRAEGKRQTGSPDLDDAGSPLCGAWRHVAAGARADDRGVDQRPRDPASRTPCRQLSG